MPSSRRSLLSDRILALVGTEWQDVEEVMERAIPLVPPGRALREYQAHRDRNEARRRERIEAGRTPGPRKPEPSDAEKRRMGARAIVNAVLGGAKDRQLVEIEQGDHRLQRRIRTSAARKYAHHCCLHGGTCRGDYEEVPADDVPAEVASTPSESVWAGTDPLAVLIERVMESRSNRLAAEPPRPEIREVRPGEIDRLLRECG